MGFFASVFVYILIWWLTLFTVLPLAYKRQEEGDKGYDSGAPVDPHLKRKLVLNTALAAVILAILQVLIVLNVIDWHTWFDGTFDLK